MYETIRPYVFTGLFTALIAYFGIQALTGDRGLLLENAREATLRGRTAELDTLTAERKSLETRVDLLQDNHLSRDLLEERARVLRWATPIRATSSSACPNRRRASPDQLPRISGKPVSLKSAMPRMRLPGLEHGAS